MRFNDSFERIPWPRRKFSFLNVMCAGAVIRALVEHSIAGTYHKFFLSKVAQPRIVNLK